MTWIEDLSLFARVCVCSYTVPIQEQRAQHKVSKFYERIEKKTKKKSASKKKTQANEKEKLANEIRGAILFPWWRSVSRRWAMLYAMVEDAWCALSSPMRLRCACAYFVWLVRRALLLCVRIIVIRLGLLSAFGERCKSKLTNITSTAKAKVAILAMDIENGGGGMRIGRM